MGWVLYEPNPVRTGAGDCAVRAVAKALGLSWEEAYTRLSANGFQMGNVISADEVWGSVLRQNGFTRHLVPNTCPDCYSVEDFSNDHPNGLYVVKSENHVATIVSGTLYDSWPSQDKTVIYFWTKEEM